MDQSTPATRSADQAPALNSVPCSILVALWRRDACAAASEDEARSPALACFELTQEHTEAYSALCGQTGRILNRGFAAPVILLIRDFLTKSLLFLRVMKRIPLIAGMR